MPYVVGRADLRTDEAFAELGQTMLELRSRRGMTQRRLAASAGLSQATICRIERGQAPGLPVWKLAKILGALTMSHAEAIELGLRSRYDHSPYFELLEGAFGIGGELDRKAREAWVERTARVQALIQARVSAVDGDSARPRLRTGPKLREKPMPLTRRRPGPAGG
jgi:transcriptional regulator with XRE-family HTH domain